jgi:hypothetical protein
LIEAFKRAFPIGSGAKLVLKSINAGTRPDEHERIVLAAGEHPDIVLIDDYVSGAQKNAMIGHCDCYVSLHRSEGFGLTAAEAMLLAKPVIATRYGGTLEFMNDENSYLVDWKPVPVGEGASPYPADGIWAEPDLDHAAALMHHAFTERDEACKKGEVARHQMRERHSPAAAGLSMERRLITINERLYDEGARSLNLVHMPSLQQGDVLHDRIANPPWIDWGDGRSGHLRWRAQRPLAEWAKAYIEHQRGINAEMHLALGRIETRLREVTETLQRQQSAQLAQTLAVLRKLQAELDEIRGANRPKIADDASSATSSDDITRG